MISLWASRRIRYSAIRLLSVIGCFCIQGADAEAEGGGPDCPRRKLQILWKWARRALVSLIDTRGLERTRLALAFRNKRNMGTPKPAHRGLML